jgi:rSAM/selenodomain-associated transferase 1
VRAGFGLMCKPPLPGLSKTRLAAAIGDDEAARLAAAFLADSAELLSEVAERFGAPRTAFHAGPAAAMAPHLSGWTLAAQPEGDLGLRMAAAFDALFGAGVDAAVLVGTDAPTLPAALLELLAPAVARGADAALVPARDGGYCAIALPRPTPALLRDLPWSTPALLEATRARAEAEGLNLVVLDAWFDVDTVEDLDLLRASLDGLSPAGCSHLPPFRASATRHALSRN